MKLKIINIGRVRDGLVLEREAEYLKRLGKSWRVEISELANSLPNSMSTVEVQAREAELLLQHLPKKGQVLLLDENGKLYNSQEFATFISSFAEIILVIGGAYGFSPELRKKYPLISLSTLTFPHQLVRLLLVEQIYRSYTLLNNLPYHK